MTVGAVYTHTNRSKTLLHPEKHIVHHIQWSQELGWAAFQRDMTGIAPRVKEEITKAKDQAVQFLGRGGE